MPAKRKTKSDKLREKFDELYRVGKAKARLSEQDVSEIAGMTTVTLWKRKNNPQDFKLSELVKLATAFKWSGEDLQSLISTLM